MTASLAICVFCRKEFRRPHWARWICGPCRESLRDKRKTWERDIKAARKASRRPNAP